MLSKRNSSASQNAELIEYKGSESSPHYLKLRNPAERHEGECGNAAQEHARRFAENPRKAGTSSVWIVMPSLDLNQKPPPNRD